MVTDHKLDKLMGPSGTAAGYSLVIFGLITTYFHRAGLIPLMAGMFMAFTYDGTLIDFSTRRIKAYRSLFGLLKTGKWYDISFFNKFRIYKSNRTYKSYSQANIPSEVKKTDIRLMLLNNDGSLKITVNKFNSFEEARKEMAELIRDLNMTGLKEWII